MIKTILYATYLMLAAYFGYPETAVEAPVVEEEIEPLIEVVDELPEEIVGQTGPQGEHALDGPMQTVPDYMLFQGVRSDIAQPQTYGLSYALSIEMNNWSRHYIDTTPGDYSDLKIVCIGDSITAGANAAYGYPEVIGGLLNPREVVNMGVGGSGIGAYSAEPMFSRYQDIPKDTDVIVVCSGINDSFALEEYRAESFSEELKQMLTGILTEYPNAKVMYLIQPPSVLFDSIKAENPALLTQEVFRREILLRCLSLGIEAIDLYNSNCMNPYDAQVMEAFYSDDQVHPNKEGQEVIGAVIAARIAVWAQNYH